MCVTCSVQTQRKLSAIWKNELIWVVLKWKQEVVIVLNGELTQSLFSICKVLQDCLTEVESKKLKLCV